MPALDRNVVSFITNEKEREAVYVLLSQAFNNSIADYKLGYEKIAVEFSRYKQDCRKRALDLAIDSAAKFRNDVGVKVSDGKVIPDLETIIPMFADKYYNWLITIPQ